MNNLSIVLSTYNEEDNIRQTLTKLINNSLISEVVIVDDNSNDQTVKIVNEIKNEKVKLFIRKNTKGFASAFIFGLLMCKGEYIMRFDIDMHSEVDLFLQTFKKNTDKDCVIFSRYVAGGGDQRGLYRKLSSLIINKLCQYLLSNKIKDYTSCIMFFKKDLLMDVIPKNTHYANFIIEFIFFLILKKKNYLEVGFIQKKNTELNSKSSPNILVFFKNGFFYLLTILRCILFRIKI